MTHSPKAQKTQKLMPDLQKEENWWLTFDWQEIKSIGTKKSKSEAQEPNPSKPLIGSWGTFKKSS